MTWVEAKDGILVFFAGGLAFWVAFEVRELRIAVTALLEKVDGHEKRISKLEDDTSYT